MKSKQPTPEHRDAEEREASNELRTLLRPNELLEQGPDDAYWHDLIARTNRRLDEAASGKAISISWAARVAIPGVVAIIFFFVSGIILYSKIRKLEADQTELVRKISIQHAEKLNKK